MTIVKELNTLSEKVVGTNPKATTDAQAVKYIADNYTGGGGGSYVLPKASADTLGGVKVGSNLSIDENGVLSASGGGSATSYVADISAIIDAYMDAQEPNTYTYNFASLQEAGKLIDEIKAAYDAKQPLLLDLGSGGYLSGCNFWCEASGEHALIFFEYIYDVTTDDGILRISGWINLARLNLSPNKAQIVKEEITPATTS